MFEKSCNNCEFYVGPSDIAGEILCGVSGEICGEPDKVCDEWEASFADFQDGKIPEEALFE